MNLKEIRKEMDKCLVNIENASLDSPRCPHCEKPLDYGEGPEGRPENYKRVMEIGDALRKKRLAKK